MRRKIEAILSEWKNNPNHRSMILTGCRQVGKTYSVKEFGQKYYKDVVYINFEEKPETKRIFDGNLDYKTILDRVETVNKKRLSEGDSLLILDEIQSCRNAFSSLKALSQQKSTDVIALGSFLGIYLDDDDSAISPVGHVDIVRMHPMDFEEYLWAMGYDEELVSSIKAHILSHEHIDDVINHSIEDSFKRYVVVGGMPSAVRAYSESGKYMAAHNELTGILDILFRDVGRYSSKPDRMKIRNCLESIPNQLARKDGKFRYIDVEKNSGSGERYYGSALDWLRNAGLIEYCMNIEGLELPLSVKERKDGFKAYMCDTGLLVALMDDPDIDGFVNGYANIGALMENAVASALMKTGIPLRFYEKKDSTVEIDFVYNDNGTIVMVEVKSGRNTRSRALNKMLEEDKKRIGLKIMEGNVMADEAGAIHLPLYGACFLEKPLFTEADKIDPASANQRFKDIGTEK